MAKALRMVGFGMVIVGIGAVMYYVSPGLRARVRQESRALMGWTDTARRADPQGFATHVEHRLSGDLEELTETRRTLAMEVGVLAKKEREQNKLLTHAEEIVNEFRDVHQRARGDQDYPVHVRNAQYSRNEVVRQVSLLLAEAEGYRKSLGQLAKVREMAEQRLEELTVRMNATEAQLAAIATQRGLLRSRSLTSEAATLLSQVDELLDGNRVVMHDNPVRSVRELLASAESPKKEARPSLDQARRFLAVHKEDGVAEANRLVDHDSKVYEPGETLTVRIQTGASSVSTEPDGGISISQED